MVGEGQHRAARHKVLHVIKFMRANSEQFYALGIYGDDQECWRFMCV